MRHVMLIFNQSSPMHLAELWRRFRPLVASCPLLVYAAKLWWGFPWVWFDSPGVLFALYRSFKTCPHRIKELQGFGIYRKVYATLCNTVCSNIQQVQSALASCLMFFGLTFLHWNHFEAPRKDATALPPTMFPVAGALGLVRGKASSTKRFQMDSTDIYMGNICIKVQFELPATWSETLLGLAH